MWPATTGSSCPRTKGGGVQKRARPLSLPNLLLGVSFPKIPMTIGVFGLFQGGKERRMSRKRCQKKWQVMEGRWLTSGRKNHLIDANRLSVTKYGYVRAGQRPDPVFCAHEH